MELKLKYFEWFFARQEGSNRTFMELKYNLRRNALLNDMF